MLGILALALSIGSAGPFEATVTADGRGGAEVVVAIPEGYALYADRSKVMVDGRGILPATPMIIKDDPVMGLEHPCRGEARFQIASWTPASVATITLQGCDEIQIICYPPKTLKISAE